jgi:hypothetical protein
MDFAKLGQNEKLAVYGAAGVILGGLVGYSYGLTILAVLAAIAMLAVVFLPQMSPGTNLPGSKGSLMLVCGSVAAVVLVLAVVIYVGTIFTATNVRDIFFLIAVIGGVVMSWAGWREFQAEGGKFQLGSSGAAAASGTAAPAAEAPAAEAPAPAAQATAAADDAAASAAAAPQAVSDAATDAGATAADAVDETRPPA